MSNILSSSLTTRSYEDDIDDSEAAGAYGDVFGKSIEKLKDTSSVSSFYSTLEHWIPWMEFSENIPVLSLVGILLVQLLQVVDLTCCAGTWTRMHGGALFFWEVM